MDDSVTKYASTYSTDVLPGDMDYERTLVELEIQEPSYVSFRLRGAQFSCQGGYIDDAGEIKTDNDTCAIRVRFNDDPPAKFAARELGDSNEWLSVEDGQKFLAGIQKAKTIKVELPLFRVGSPVLSFQVEGFDPKKLAAAKPKVVP
jgi:hypothetical protein